MAPANPFWDFSLAVYRNSGVADACLRLQDDAGADVNLVLFCCWISTVREAALTDEEMREAIALTRDWREQVVSPLRQIRRGLKAGAKGLPPEPVESFRSEIKRAELASERLQQDMLFRWAERATSELSSDAASAQAAEKNIVLYLTVIGVEPTQKVLDDCRYVADVGAQFAR